MTSANPARPDPHEALASAVRTMAEVDGLLADLRSAYRALDLRSADLLSELEGATNRNLSELQDRTSSQLRTIQESAVTGIAEYQAGVESLVSQSIDMRAASFGEEFRARVEESTRSIRSEYALRQQEAFHEAHEAVRNNTEASLEALRCEFDDRFGRVEQLIGTNQRDEELRARIDQRLTTLGFWVIVVGVVALLALAAGAGL